MSEPLANRWNQVANPPSETGRIRTLFLCTAFGLFALSFGGGCGVIAGGIALLTGRSGGSSGGGNSPAFLLLDVEPLDLKTSPATIRFIITDPESDPVDVELSFRKKNEAPVPLCLVGDTKLCDLSSDGDGEVHERLWNFADQLGTPLLTRMVELTIAGCEGGRTIDPSGILVDVGNDPPEARGVGPEGEVVGTVAIEFQVSDSDPDDSISVTAEFKLDTQDTQVKFRPATGDVVIGSDGRPTRFFWQVVDDLGFTEHDIVFQVTPRDGFDRGSAAELRFRVDNNREPLVVLDSSSFVQNPDRRRGVPIPFTVFDGDNDTGEPGDEISLVFQWRRSSDPGFCPLPLDDVDRFLLLVRNSSFRRDRRICTERKLGFGGRLRTVHSTGVRLPELAGSAASLVETDPDTLLPRVQGVLELLRTSRVPTPVAGSWGANATTLREPVAALPLRDGRVALVLENLPGQWRLRGVRLADGMVLTDPKGNETIADGEPIIDPVGNGTVAAGPGVSTAMGFEPGERSVLIAVTEGTGVAWRIVRIRLDGEGENGEILAFDGSTEGGPIRGVVALRDESALFTVGSSLIRADYPAGSAPTSTPLFGPSPLTPLAGPWGIVVRDGCVLVAETEADRVTIVDLATFERRPVPIATPSDLLRPRSLALERSGKRLLIVTDRDPTDGTQELRALDLGDATDSEEIGAADAKVFLIYPREEGEPGFEAPVGAIATGSDGLRLLALTAESDLAVGGGVQQSRRIREDSASYEPLRQEVQVIRPFEPDPTERQPWRIRRSAAVVSGRPGGTVGSFVWASEDVPREEFVVVRAIPIDREIGIATETNLSKRIRGPVDFFGVSIDVGEAISDGPTSIAVADLDCDGDLDFVSANEVGNNLTLFFQTSPGIFRPGMSDPEEGGNTLSLGGPGITDRPRSVAAADLDGDGRTDIVSANLGARSLTIFRQTSSGVYDPVPRILTPGSGAPRSVAVADLDRDGDLDIVSANEGSNDLTLFRQTTAGTFELDPVSLGGPGLTGIPEFVELVDVDGDGLVDVISANGASDTLTVFFQKPDGFDPDPLILGGSESTDRPVRIATGDLDGDGRIDIASANLNSETLTVFLQRERRRFDRSPSIVLGGSEVTPIPTALIAADLDGDGDLDIASTNLAGRNTTLFFQTEPGYFDPTPQTIAAGDFSDSPLDLQVADLDGDGDLDLVIPGLLSDRLNVLFRTSLGAFDPQPSLVLGGPETTPRLSEVAVGDLDGDGDLDLVSANRVSNNLTVFFQNRPRIFRPAPLVLGGPFETDGAFAVAIGDMDGDGDLDVVSANSAGDTVSVFFQGLPGSFESSITLGSSALTDAPRGIAVGDLNGDGALDIVSANNLGDNLTIFFQIGVEEFDPMPLTIGNSVITNSPEGVTIADLDGDGDLDIVSANEASNNLTIFMQRSPGQFDEMPQVLSDPDPRRMNGPQSVAALDLDGDGDLDLVSANQGSNNLAIFFQVAPGRFDSAPSVLLGREKRTAFPTAVAGGDLDGDGDIDIVCANSAGNSLSVFFQTGIGVFNPIPVQLGVGVLDAPRSLAIIDVDGDGDIDVVSGNRESSQITLFFGGGS